MEKIFLLYYKYPARDDFSAKNLKKVQLSPKPVG